MSKNTKILALITFAVGWFIFMISLTVSDISIAKSRVEKVVIAAETYTSESHADLDEVKKYMSDKFIGQLENEELEETSHQGDFDIPEGQPGTRPVKKFSVRAENVKVTVVPLIFTANATARYTRVVTGDESSRSDEVVRYRLVRKGLFNWLIDSSG